MQSVADSLKSTISRYYEDGSSKTLMDSIQQHVSLYCALVYLFSIFPSISYFAFMDQSRRPDPKTADNPGFLNPTTMQLTIINIHCAPIKNIQSVFSCIFFKS